ncbi:MAG: pyrimidine/purine nucleoside phosphorylase [Rikenellaceae bacterium]
MFAKNEYFDGKVASLAFEGNDGKATAGVMAAGEYVFGTSTIEIMTVVSGEMDVKLPGETEYTTYKQFESFEVAKDTKFGVRVSADTAYLCLYK